MLLIQLRTKPSSCSEMKSKKERPSVRERQPSGSTPLKEVGKHGRNAPEQVEASRIMELVQNRMVDRMVNRSRINAWRTDSLGKLFKGGAFSGRSGTLPVRRREPLCHCCVVGFVEGGQGERE